METPPISLLYIMYARTYYIYILYIFLSFLQYLKTLQSYFLQVFKGHITTAISWRGKEILANPKVM